MEATQNEAQVRAQDEAKGQATARAMRLMHNRPQRKPGTDRAAVRSVERYAEAEDLEPPKTPRKKAVWSPEARARAADRARQMWDDPATRMRKIARTDGNGLREVRYLLGWSQERFGRALGLAPGCAPKVCSLEQKAKLPQAIYERAYALASAHGLNTDLLAPLRPSASRSTAVPALAPIRSVAVAPAATGVP